MKKTHGNKGFTLIELLLVVVVIGLMMAVIIPRGQRATTDSKYSLVRQNCTELAANGSQWMERMIEAQDESSAATRADYLVSLSNGNTGEWIADSADSNWNKTAGIITVPGRDVGGTGSDVNPEIAVENLIDPGKVPRNPFNGVSVFNAANYSDTAVIPGQIALGRIVDDSITDITGGATANGLWFYYAFVFQGTDSAVANTPDFAQYHAGMGTGITLPGLRNGVFFTRERSDI